MADTTLSASARGASFLILLQVGSRALTFALNQILLRYLSPDILGISVQLELYCISVLYFSRESLRVALQRRADGVQAVVNLAYLALIAGIPIGFVLARLYLRTGVPDVPHLGLSVWLYGIAAVIELMSEPAFVAAQQLSAYKVRARAEAVATVGKTAVTVGLVLKWSREGRSTGVLAFADGQLAYAMLLLIMFGFDMGRIARTSGFSLWPRIVGSG